MKKLYTILILLLIFIANKSSAANFILSDSTIKSDSNKVIINDERPIFPGGDRKLIRYIEKNTKYPKEALKNNIEGKVYVSFIIEKDGSVSTATIVSGLGYGCDDEALRVISSLPKFTPGKQNGYPVRVKYTIPINFFIWGYRKK